ncbi:hypothetical protein SBRCBS47491_002173 [Sporothrix bragantina]|uniref:DUF7730 domain-containing protein n=1 Tax=Sporothrix bragantina TaxID=671064 RepID=A0ABP0B5B1_9PEZI
MSFLDLPPNVRRRIYEYALVRDECPIDLTYWATRSYEKTYLDSRNYLGFRQHQCWRRKNDLPPYIRHCVCERLPVALLRVCRTVFREAAAVLYGGNKFVLRGRTFASQLEQDLDLDKHDKRDKLSDVGEKISGDSHHGSFFMSRVSPTEQFAPLLENIPLYGLAHMTSLLVRLNCWPCPLGHEEVGVPARHRIKENPFQSFDDNEKVLGFCRFCSMRSDRADALFSLPSASDSETEESTEYDNTAARQKTAKNKKKNAAMLQVWECLCARLAEAVKMPQHQPGQLDLTLICDVTDVKAAERVVAPLTQALVPATRLKACTVRLGRRRRDYALTAFARQTATALVEGAISELSSSEPQSKDIFPFHRLPAELRVKILGDTVLGRTRRILFHNGREYTQAKEQYLDRVCCDLCTPTLRDCCCPKYYASFSAHCQCDILPTELFYVDRLMYREAALDQLYSKAVITFQSDQSHMTLAVLESMTPAALRSITKLYFRISSIQYRQWRVAIRSGSSYSDDEDGDGDGRDNDFDEDGNERPRMPRKPYEYVHEPGRGDEGWADLVAFIRDNMDFSRLEICLDMEDCVWDYYESFLISDEPTSQLMDRFRDAYVMYMDLVTELCTLKTLKAFAIRLAVFDDLERWLVREVLGPKRDIYKGGITAADIEGAFRPGHWRRPHVKTPYYHNPDRHLPGSNWDSEA